MRGSNPWLVLLCLALGQFMVVVDVTILNIALPAIAEDLHASMAGIQWALIAYSLTMIGLVPTFGRLSDLLGRKHLFITGLVVFSGASAMAAMAHHIELLIAARVVQAVGGALITSNTLAILADTFPEGRRGVAMGIQAILISGGAAIGPVLGGLLVTQFGWEAVFLVNLPVGGLAATLSIVLLPTMQRAEGRPPFDLPGAVLLTVALAGLLLATTKGVDWGWSSAATLSSFFAGLVASAAFGWRERHFAHPIIDPSLLRNRPFITGQLAGTLAMLSLLGLAFLMPFYWQGLRAMSAQRAGLLMLPLPLGIMLLSPICGRLSDVLGARGMTTTGMLLVSVGLLLMSSIKAETGVVNVLLRYSLLGLGLGMFLAPNNNAIMNATPPQHRGVASGLIALFRFSGQCIGIALSGTVFLHAASGPGVAHRPSPSELAQLGRDPQMLQALRGPFESGFRTVCLVVIPLSLLAAALCFARGASRARLGSESSNSKAKLGPLDTM